MIPSVHRVVKLLLLQKDSKYKVNCSDELHMETDQAEQLNTLLSQSSKAVNKNWDTEETSASTTSKWQNTPPVLITKI